MATAKEAGWHVSRYNLAASIPGTENTAIVNLYKGNCGVYTPIEIYLMSVLEELDEHHPIISRFAKRGIICKFDERSALESMGKMACAFSQGISLTICPTMGCNFDCPYCFENHRQSRMSPEVQDNVIALAERMLDAAGTKNLRVTWFGGEPLLASDILESLSLRLIELVQKRGGQYTASVITNGYLLTKENIEMLDRVQVKDCQVTIDGLGDTHNATRHLAGGGPTFDRIVDNLKNHRIPFHVNIRHNVHTGNQSEIDELKAFVRQIAAESGNNLSYYLAPVLCSTVADARGKQVRLLCGSVAGEVGILQEAHRFHSGRGHFCGAQSLWHVGIDDQGRLYKCWESVDKPKFSFGLAHDWDPKNPLETANHIDNLTRYLNTCGPVPDEECKECVWLPMCSGGCPNKRLHDSKNCVAFKDNPEQYVLALYEQIGKQKTKAD